MFLKELETYNDLDALKEKAEEKKKVSCCLDVVMVCILDVVMVSCSRWKMVKTSFIFYCIRVLALNVSVSNSYLF